jgi:hypothetical protein
MKGQKNNDYSPVSSSVDRASLLSHELGNVLNGLLGMTELLAESGLNDEQNRWLKAMEHSGLQLLALIQPERFTPGGPALNLEPRVRRLDGVHLLEQVLVSHAPAAQSRYNRLLMAVSSELPRYWNCDPCMVRQLLDNILGNAIKFTQSGDVVLEVLADPECRMLQFVICDSGPGIHYQGRHSASVSEQKVTERGWTAVNGKGIGLQICRQIVSAMGGRIECLSPASGGTRIEISLPEMFDRSATADGLGCTLFKTLRCHLKLDEPLHKCVVSILDRLGVEWSNELLQPSDRFLLVEISEDALHSTSRPTAIRLSPLIAGVSSCRPKYIEMPVLESSVGPVLLEMVLQWRGQAFRRDKPDSTP